MTNEKELQHQMMMVTSVAYEMRDPTAVILVAKDAIEKIAIDHLPQEKQKKLSIPMRCIEQSVDKLERISMNLLDISHHSFGDLKACCEPLCVSELCTEICEEAQKFGQSRRIICSVPRQAIVMLMDSYFFERILLNLLSNAMTACPEGKISVDLKKNKQELILIVSDSGPGLSQERLQSPFAPIYRTENSDTKLGLYICSLLAKQLDGELTAENMPKGGARFVLRVPIKESNNEQVFKARNVDYEKQARKRRIRAEFALFEGDTAQS